MATTETVQTVIEIAGKACKAPTDGLTADTKWIDDMGVKSVYAVKICALIKMKFGVDFPLETLIGNVTLGDTADAIEAILA